MILLYGIVALVVVVIGHVIGYNKGFEDAMDIARDPNLKQTIKYNLPKIQNATITTYYSEEA